MVNVEYRLAPEYKYTACVQDAMCAATWVMKNKIKIGRGPIQVYKLFLLFSIDIVFSWQQKNIIYWLYVV